MTAPSDGRSVSTRYDSIYSKRDAFGHDTLLYRAFIRAIVGFTGMRPGSRILDAGCGQGYLSSYLAGCGMNVWCSDLSAVGLQSLARYGPLFTGKRVVADLRQPPFAPVFDLVFQRSCSLFNDREAHAAGIVDPLIDCAKVGGTICVVYNSNLSGHGDVWFNHTIETFSRAFTTGRLGTVDVYAVNNLDCLVLGRWSFNRPLTQLNAVVSRLSDRCSEIVVVGRRIR